MMCGLNQGNFPYSLQTTEVGSFTFLLSDLMKKG